MSSVSQQAQGQEAQQQGALQRVEGGEEVEGKDIKYILVSGGVITSSIGTLLKSMGLRVTAIKIDPYLNIDAGTFSPYEHGKSSIQITSFCPW